MIQFAHSYDDIISVDNLLAAWREFVKGKKNKRDVQIFSLALSDNILSLHNELVSKCYIHGHYIAFNINDPKPRNIHKASVRDRLLHHALYRKLYPFFDKTFIGRSYSCRRGKGTHRAIAAFRSFSFQSSQNHTKTLWVLKCDVKKFFASVNHVILMKILAKYISDQDVLNLLSKVIASFHSTHNSVGLPLGNLTSQLLVNIYMNEFDKYIKHVLKVKYYIRYADDFVVFSRDRAYLEGILSNMSNFLWSRLRLRLHPDKVFIKTVASGVDFLGWVHFTDHRVLRTSTRRRMWAHLTTLPTPSQQVITSYTGLLNYGNTFCIKTWLSGYIFT